MKKGTKMEVPSGSPRDTVLESILAAFGRLLGLSSEALGVQNVAQDRFGRVRDRAFIEH